MLAEPAPGPYHDAAMRPRSDVSPFKVLPMPRRGLGAFETWLFFGPPGAALA
jgi:hypothetical protein